MTVKVYYAKGLRIRFRSDDFTILLDPSGRAKTTKADLVLVSHGHSDHVSGLPSTPSNAAVYTSPITKEVLMVSGIGKRVGSYRMRTIQPGQEVVVGNVAIRAYDAGHIMGSVLFEVERVGFKIAYTGDFNYEASITAGQAEEVDRPDVLVMESTYGYESYNFPSRDKMYQEIASWIEGNVERGCTTILTGFALGKSQELTAIASQVKAAPIVVDEQVAQYNQIFDRKKFKLGNYISFRSPRAYKLIKEGVPLVLVMPSLKLFKHVKEALSKSLKLRTPAKIALFSGWVANKKVYYALKRKYGLDALFPLSNHSDFDALLEYVENVRPKKVYTVFGMKKALAKAIKRKLGIPAREVTDPRQRTLYKWFARSAN